MKKNPVGRPSKKEHEKKVQVIFYIPKANVEAFRSKVDTIKKKFEKI